MNKNKGNNKTKKIKNKTKKNKTFSKKHYSSGEGMLTSVWGPSLWHYLHTMSFNYPTNPTNADKKNYRDYKSFLSSLI